MAISLIFGLILAPQGPITVFKGREESMKVFRSALATLEPTFGSSVDSVRSDGAFASTNGMLTAGDSFQTFYFFRKVNGKWTVFASFSEPWTSWPASQFRAFDFRLLRDVGFPKEAMPDSYRSFIVRLGWTYGFARDMARTEFPLTAVQLLRTKRADPSKRFVVKGFKGEAVYSVLSLVP